MQVIEKEATKQGYQEVIESSENALTEVREWPDDMPIGAGGDQGDLLMWRLPNDFDTKGCKKVDATQLAPGATQGSRHTIECPNDVIVWQAPNHGQFVNTSKVRERPMGYIQGYVLEVKNRTMIAHPEHAWHSVPCGFIQTAGQVDARTLEWAKD